MKKQFFRSIAVLAGVAFIFIPRGSVMVENIQDLCPKSGLCSGPAREVPYRVIEYGIPLRTSADVFDDGEKNNSIFLLGAIVIDFSIGFSMVYLFGMLSKRKISSKPKRK